MLELGIRVKDKVSGLEGIITGRSQWLNGCRSYGVQAKMDKDGKIPETKWIDEGQLEIIDSKSILEPADELTGGPTEIPQKGY